MRAPPDTVLIRHASDRCPGPLPLGSPARYVYFSDFRRLRLPLTMSLSWVASPAREAPRERPKCTKSTRMGAPGAPLRLGTLPRRVPDPHPQRSNGCDATCDIRYIFFRSPPGALMLDECCQLHGTGCRLRVTERFGTNPGCADISVASSARLERYSCV